MITENETEAGEGEAATASAPLDQDTVVQQLEDAADSLLQAMQPVEEIVRDLNIEIRAYNSALADARQWAAENKLDLDSDFRDLQEVGLDLPEIDDATDHAGTVRDLKAE